MTDHEDQPRDAQGRFSNGGPSLREYLEQRLKAHVEAHSEHLRAHDREHSMTERALAKAEQAMEKRLETMNEFREQLREQASNFVRRDALESTEEDAEKTRLRLEDDLTRRYEELRALIGTEREERRATEGLKRGMNQTTTLIIGAVGLASSVAVAVVVVVNLLIGA